MKKYRFNPLVLLSLLSLLGLNGIVKHDPLWYSWFAWIVYLRYLKPNNLYDERFDENFNKSCRNGFFIALFGMAGIITIKAMELSDAILRGSIAVVFIAMIIGSLVSLIYYEKKL